MSTTPLLPGFGNPQVSPFQVTDINQEIPVNVTLGGADDPVLEVVNEVLGFASTLLAASEAVGKRLPVSGKTLPVETEPTPLTAGADEDTVLTALPLVGELKADLRLRAPRPVVTSADSAAAIAVTPQVPTTSVDAPLVSVTRLATALPDARSLPVQSQTPTLAAPPVKEASLFASATDRLIGDEPPPGDDSQAPSVKPGAALPVPPRQIFQPLKAPLRQPATVAPNVAQFDSTPVVQPQQPLGMVDTDAIRESVAAIELQAGLSDRSARVAGATPASTALPATAVALPAGFAAQAPTSPTPTVVLATPLAVDNSVADGEWGQQFAERVGWVIHAKVPRAQVRLVPEHLGPIELAVEVDDQVARVQFNAAHALTRDAIEQSLPKLRAMLEQEGISLEQADVSGSPHQGGDSAPDAHDGAPESSNRTDNGALAAASTDAVVDDNPLARRARGLIDTYV